MLAVGRYDFSADLAERADHRDEERRFLEDMPGSLGPAAVRAPADVAAALGLDYGGIDFGIDRAGNVVVFEANTTMAVYRPVAEDRTANRLHAMVGAVHGLIERRAAS